MASGLSRLLSDGFEVVVADLVNVRIPGEVVSTIPGNKCGDVDVLLTPTEVQHLRASLSRALVALDVVEPSEDWRGAFL